MVELNQICTCKSGLKYRECCLPLQELIELMKESGMSNEFKIYAERYALNVLLKKSKVFKAFYNSERTNIINRIIWSVDPSLSANMRTSFITGGNYNLITSKRAPIDLVDEFDTAHELRHLLLAQQGFPKASVSDYGTKNGYDTRYATVLLNSVMDPLVNSGLGVFGFDLWGYYDKASQVQKQQREAAFQRTWDNRNKYFEVSFYIQKVLDWEIANAQSPRPNDAFLEWFRCSFPLVIQEATRILGEIRQMGYDTPEKARLILTRIIRQFNMGDIITLV